jgi:hypothetical protein
MSVVLIVVIVIAVLLLLLFMGGLVASRRRIQDPDYERHLREADRALEQARAADRGWDRALLEQACRRALGDERPGFECDTIDLVLVDDRPGVTEDRAHLVARGGGEEARVVLTRRESGDWMLERID